jgi:hypothetical protein
MDNKLKRNIQKAFEAPQPNRQEKARFLRVLPGPRISMFRFILVQASYMRKMTLVFSVLLLLPAVIGANYISENTLWIVSTFVPILGLLAVAESTRSTIYGMSEFEMSTRFSLKSVVMARMSVLGVLDFIVLACAIPLCYTGSRFSLLQTGLYLLVPYMLTVNISLWIIRHFQSRETIYVCMSVAALIGGANVGLHFITDLIYQNAYIVWWFILSVLLFAGMAHEIYLAIKQTEEYTWNLSLTD